jgi:MFS family permease
VSRVIGHTLRLVRGLPPQVQLLVGGSLVNRLGSFIVPYLSLVLVREFGLTAERAALMIGAYGAGSLVSVLTGGFLTDTLGRRRTLLLSLVGSGLFALGMALAPSLRLFVPMLVGFAFLADLYRPASSAMLGDHLPSSQRAVGFAALRVAVNLGFAVGMGLGGLLVDWSWRAMFAADGVTTLAFGIVVYAWIRESRPSEAAEALEATLVASGAPGAPGSPWRDPVFLQVSLASLAFAMLIFSDFTVFPLTATLSAGYPASVFGLLVGVNGVLVMLFEVSLTAWLARFRRLRVAAVGALLAGAGVAITGLVLHWAWFLLAVLLWTAGEILTVPQQSAFVTDWAPPLQRGRYLSLYTATWSLAIAVNPLVCLPLHARLGERLFWALLGLLALPAAWLVWRLDATADRPEHLRGLTPEPS